MRNRKSAGRGGVLAGLLAAVGVLLAALAGADGAAAAGTAAFRVTPRIVNAGLEPFTATVPPFGNGRRLGVGGFEPAVYRTMFLTTEAAPDRVIARPGDLAVGRSLRSGALDGAHVDVWRIENGAFRLVRTDRVAAGGFRVDGWTRLFALERFVPVAEPGFVHAFAPWHRPGATVWFAVRTVDPGGRLSGLSEPVAVRVDPPEQAQRPRNRIVRAPQAPARSAVPGPLPVPVGLKAEPAGDGMVRLSWTRTEDASVAGYVVYQRDSPPEAEDGNHMLLEGGAAGPPLRAGDLVMVHKRFTTVSRRSLHRDEVWGARGQTRLLLPPGVDFWPDEDPGVRWSLEPHPPGTPVTEPGETYLALGLDAGERRRIGLFNHAGPENRFYPVLEPKPIRVEAWLRSPDVRRPGQVRFVLQGPLRDAVRPVAMPVGPEWRKVSFTFTPPAHVAGSAPGMMAIEFAGPGTLHIDNFRIFYDDAPWLGFDATDTARLQASGMRLLRTHAFIKTGRRSYDLAELTAPGGLPSGIHGGNSLPQTLGAFERVGIDPWLQVEPHLRPEEWAGLVEYLAAPFDPARDSAEALPWAARRHAQGRTRPWTEAFGTILIEVGNETWNPLFAPWTFPPMRDASTGRRYPAGAVYGLFTNQVIAQMRASPHWTRAGLDGKIAFVLGGWGAQADWGLAAADTAPQARYLTVGAYNGGWDENEGPPALTLASFASVFDHVAQVTIPRARVLARETAARADRRPGPLRPGTYEAGPGYAMNGLNGARVTRRQNREQEMVMKSQAGGVATLDAFLAMAAEGFALQNFFTFSEGERWTSHAARHSGGAATPAWQLLTLFNRVGPGDMLAVETLAVPTRAVPARGRRRAVPQAPEIAAYATRQGDRFTLVLLSRRLAGWPDAASGGDGYTPVTVDLPFRTARRLTLYRMAGEPTAHTVDGPDVGIEDLALPVPADTRRFVAGPATGADPRGLPPGSAFVYVFEGIAP